MGRNPKPQSRQSKLQKAQFAATRNNEGRLKKRDKENYGAETSSPRTHVHPEEVLAETQHKLGNTQRKVRRLQNQQKKLKGTVESTKKEALMVAQKLEASERHNDTLQKHRGELMTELASEINAHREHKQEAAQKCIQHRNDIKNMKKRLLCAEKLRKDAFNRAKLASKPIFKLIHKRMYSTASRKLMRMLVANGCARAKVGKVLGSISSELGVKMNSGRVASRRTVSRAVLEGYIAGQAQIGSEVSNSQALTISADGTSNRGIDFEARHIALRVPNYANGDLSIDPNSVPRIRLLCVDSTVEHTSNAAVDGFLNRVDECLKIFNETQYAKTLQKTATLSHFLSALKGMNGDHASKEKSAGKGMAERKHKAAVDNLGEERLLSMTVGELVQHLGAWNQKKLAQIGGRDEWDKLSTLEQARVDKQLMADIVNSLGQEEYNALSPEERRPLDLFIWAGCCMHKDQNSFKGGNTEMMLEWEKLDLPPPLLLANKANSATLRKILEPGGPDPMKSPLSEDEQRAFEQTTRGGVKTTALAGAIFNNKDDKKGQGDKHVNHFQEVVDKDYKRFPDTNNTHFGTHGEAAADLILYLDAHVNYLNLIRLSKHSGSLTQIENNVLQALNDAPTLTELCAMALYTQAVSKPYMRAVRGPNSENVLDLGPLHALVHEFVQKVIDQPDILICEDASSIDGTLDGMEWDNLKVMKAVWTLMPSLPHLKVMTVAFFRGALVTWERFSSEFAPGGLIDEATAEEKHLAWMPATNDANEGALGAYRVNIRNKPSLTLHQYNAMAMFQHNDTQAFMDVVFTEADHILVMREARVLDASGLEATRRKEIVDFRIEVARIREEKEDARKAKSKADKERLSQVEIITNISDIAGLTVSKLGDQIDAIRFRGLPNVAPKSRYPRKGERQAVLKELLIQYQAFLAEQLGDGCVQEAPESLLDVGIPIIEDWEGEEEAEMDED